MYFTGFCVHYKETVCIEDEFVVIKQKFVWRMNLWF